MPDSTDALTILFETLLKNPPSWFNNVVYFVILLGLALIFALLILGAFRFAQSINKESQAFDLSEKNATLNKLNLDLMQLIINIRNSLEALNTYVIKVEQNTKNLDERINNKDSEVTLELIDSEVGRIISDFINLLSSELSYGNKTRVSLWTYNTKEDCLEPLFRSSNFPNSKNTSKILDINKSIAGRAFRTGEFQYTENLNSDPDWKQYFSNTYKSILAVPVDGNRILTVDFKKIPPEEDQLLVQTAASLLSYLYSIVLPLKAKITPLDIDDLLSELEDLLKPES